MDSPLALQVVVTLVLGIVKFMVALYDMVTFPLYYIIQKPWQRQEAASSVRGKQVDPNNAYSPWTRTVQPPKSLLNDCDTINQLFERVVAAFGSKEAFGYRPILSESAVRQADGRAFTRQLLGDQYVWLTFNEMNQRVNYLLSGFLKQGIKPTEIVIIMADTRLEWMMSALALLKLGATVSTIYATFGQDGIVHVVNETEATHIVTSQDQLPKLLKVLSKTPKIRHITYFEGFQKPLTEKFPQDVKVIPFAMVEAQGKMTPIQSSNHRSKASDMAILMYTSGSTGVPKGVMLSHSNIIGSAAAFSVISEVLTIDDSFLAYLPLAHVLELAGEIFFMSLGMSIGYGHALTLTAKSTGLQKGCPSDFAVLKPTVAAAVPLDRIRKGILEEIEGRGALAKQLFDFVINYKRHWTKKGYQTPIINYLVCRKVKQVVGGRLRLFAVGGAPLGPETHSFIDACLDVEILQGYGLTEVAATGTLMGPTELSSGRVGAPLGGVFLKLSDWAEGNYRATDKPNPRGEILIAGPNVCSGYYKNDQLNEESFCEEDGMRWFKTGDIAEIEPKTGQIKIVDRRKDLVKLQFGEYVSLGKIEAELSSSSYVDNICVIGDSYHDYLIALVVPNQKTLKEQALAQGKEGGNFKELCDDQAITNAFTGLIISYLTKKDFNKMEIPLKVKLCSNAWNPESGLVTSSGLKIRRKNIQDFYKDEIERLYDSGATSKAT